MSDYIEVDTSKLQSDRLDVTERLSKLQAELDGLYGDMGELNAMWSGPANDAFRQRFEADREYFQSVCKELSALVQRLELAQTVYDKCDSHVNTLVNAIKVY